MIALASDCLVFRLASGESVAVSAEMLSVELMGSTLELFDPEFVRHAEPTTFRDLARVCASCQASRRCARDLSRGDVQAGMEAYCLNSATIDALTVSCKRCAAH